LKAEPRALPRPDEVFIKVYPARLQALILSADLTRTELAELIMLALRIDDERTCFPALETLAADSGHKSRLWSRTLVKRLKAKGVIDYDAKHNHSHYYVLPDCFQFGDHTSDHQAPIGDHTSDHQSPVGDHTSDHQNSVGDQTSDQGGDQTSDQGGDQTSDHEADPVISRISNKKTQSSMHADSSKVVAVGSPPPITDPEQLAAFYELQQAGVDPAEAYLMAQQYRATTIRIAIRQSNAPQVQNRGAWIRSAVVKKSAIDLHYPKASRAQLEAAAAMSLVNAIAVRKTAPSRYLDDPYFQRRAYNLEETTSDLDDSDVYERET
jgi:hypothetical protein